MEFPGNSKVIQELRNILSICESTIISFDSLALAYGKELDDEEKVQVVIDTIKTTYGWDAEIRWVERVVILKSDLPELP